MQKKRYQERNCYARPFEREREREKPLKIYYGAKGNIIHQSFIMQAIEIVQWNNIHIFD